MLKWGDNLFRFVIGRPVELTNNRAEISIRPMVTHTGKVHNDQDLHEVEEVSP